MMPLQLAVQAQIQPSKEYDFRLDPVIGGSIVSLPVILLLAIVGYRQFKVKATADELSTSKKLRV